MDEVLIEKKIQELRKVRKNSSNYFVERTIESLKEKKHGHIWSFYCRKIEFSLKMGELWKFTFAESTSRICGAN